MEIATIDFQFPIDRAAELVVRNHSADGAFDEQFRMAHPARLHVLGFVAADVTGEAHERFLIFLLSSEPHFFGVNDDDKIAGIDVRRVDRLFLAAQQIRGLYGDSAEDLVLGINDPPFAWDLISFSGKRFHAGAGGHGNYEWRRGVSTGC